MAVAPSTYTKIAGVWKKVDKIYTRAGGTWKEIDNAYQKVAGTYKIVHNNRIDLVISTNTSNYNLFTSAGSPTIPTSVVLTINSGVNLSSTSTSNPSLLIPAFIVGSDIRIINNGNIYADGGDGAAGGSGGILNDPGSSGAAGGQAISISFNVTIDNTNGNIYGGGRGGNGGISENSCGAPGGGGGGGQGDNGGSAGPAGAPGTGTGTNASAGNSGTSISPGSGGAPGSCEFQISEGIFETRFGNSGIDGGIWGNGKAINLNGNIVTWEGGNNAAQVKGAVN